jgi:hypothetical protein
MSNSQQDTFYIYTTGIADWCDLNKTFKFWEDELSKHVYELIPQRFSRISIFHSDILDDFNGVMSVTNQKKIQTTNEINNRLQLERVQNSRIVSSFFQTTPLNFILISQPHIIIDFAHVFNDTKLNVFNDSKPNVVYLGYVGEQQIIEYNMCTRYIKNFFKVNDDNTVTTYANKLSDTTRFSPLNKEYPSDNIRDIMKKIRIKLGLEFKNKHGNYDLFDSIFNEHNTEVHSKMVTIIMDNIMNTYNSEDAIIDIVIDSLRKS